MPKLNGSQILERLDKRLEELREGKEVAGKDIRALLTDEQVAAMDAAWTEQQDLRRKKRARTKEEEKELGWKTKREIYIDAYEKAIAEANEGLLETFEEMERRAKIRQARIYLETYSNAKKSGKSEEVSKNLANNDLVRAGMPRVDGKEVWYENERDRLIREMEDKNTTKTKSEMTAEELEQIELMEAHDKALAKNRKLKS